MKSCLCIEGIWVPQALWLQRSVQLRFHSGDIYSFLFLILNSLRPKSSSVGIDDHTQSMENLWVPRGLGFFSLKVELLPQFSPWRRGCPHVLLEQQGWSSRTFPHPGWRFFSCFLLPLVRFLLPWLPQWLSSAHFGGFSNVSPALMGNPTWFYWSLLRCTK